MFIAKNKGQSLLEYAILLSVVVAALILMQFILKRGYEGGLKDASDKMGDRYSLSTATSDTARTVAGDQTITDYQGTGDQIIPFLGVGAGIPANNILVNNALQVVNRPGVGQTIETNVKIDEAKQEQVRWDAVVSPVATYPDPAAIE